jgi:hypothetical protein
MAFEEFPPLIADQLHYLLNHSPDSIKIANVWSGNKINPKILDRFTLVIPYCLETIKWDVIYNSEYAMDPPDFVFGPDDEDFVPCKCSAIAPDDDQISSLEKALSEWDHEDSTRLLVIIQGLRDQYVAYQRRRVGQVDDDRVKFEISTVLTRKGIEMQMASGVDKVFIVVKIFDYLSLKLDALYAFDFPLPLFFSVARGSQVCSTSCDGYEHKQNGGWLPLEASAEDLSSGSIPDSSEI